jgi:hypothetical protein
MTAQPSISTITVWHYDTVIRARRKQQNGHRRAMTLTCFKAYDIWGELGDESWK